MSVQFEEVEQRIGYHFRNREHLRRALTCQSAINERHPDAANENFQILEFVGDAALKYTIATLLYTEPNELRSVEVLDDTVRSHIINTNLTRIGRELNLNRYIIKGRGVSDVTEKMLADAVEAILGAIVIDQQQQGNNSENILFDVIARLFSIKRHGRTSIIPPPPNNGSRKCCCCCSPCCKYFWGILIVIVLLVILGLFITDRFEL